jgi:hypothetical protein
MDVNLWKMDIGGLGRKQKRIVKLIPLPIVDKLAGSI